MLASPQENRVADKPSAEKLLDDIGTAPFAVRVEDEKSETPLHKEMVAMGQVRYVWGMYGNGSTGRGLHLARGRRREGAGR